MLRVPRERRAPRLALDVAQRVDGRLRQQRGEPVLQELGDDGSQRRAGLGGGAHVVERALDLDRVVAAQALEQRRAGRGMARGTSAAPGLASARATPPA